MTSYRDPKLLIALIIIGLFSFAYAQRPGDEVLQGALIAAFSGAWGYFLGSSSGASTNRDQVGKALDLAHQTQPRADVILKPGETAQAQDDGNARAEE